MAVNKTINKRTNTHGAMRNCIEYVLRQDKTSELLTYITGPYCHNEINYDLVYRTFLEEKKMWNKDTGRMYAHNIISWHKDEQITPEQAFEFGKEFAENWFSGFQTLVAVHKDKDHIHCHLVTNSVSYEDGRKLHNTRKDLERMKQLTNQMCRERGLTVAEKGKHFDGSQIEKGEVIAWSKDKYNLFRQQVKDSFVAVSYTHLDVYKRQAQTYIFLVDNQDIALNIVMSGYQALCLVQEDDGNYFSADSFIEEMRSIQFTGSCQSAYQYVAS